MTTKLKKGKTAMKKLLFAISFALAPLCPAAAEVVIPTDPVFLRAGPLNMYIPLKTGAVTYLYDFNENRNLVGGETTIVTLWKRIEGVVGGVTSLDGRGTPFVGGNLIIGNLVDRWVTLPPDFKIGGFGGYDFNAEKTLYGLKASVQIW